MSRNFNALSGKELSAVIRAEVGQLLDLDTRFDRTDPITSAMVTFTLTVDSYPSDDRPFVLQISQLFKGAALSPVALRHQIKDLITRTFDADLRFGHNLVYPKVTCEHRLSIEVTTPAGAVARDVTIDSPMLVDPMASRRIDTRGPVATPPMDRVSAAVSDSPTTVAEIDALEKRLAQLRASVAVDDRPVARPISASEVRHRDFDPYTATGLEMEREWKASPGMAMAGSFGGGAPIGSVQTKDAITRIELGVSHPSLDEGGMGAPDQVRRDASLPIPATQNVAGQIVDLPLGSF
jgi:hypothetical protein